MTELIENHIMTKSLRIIKVLTLLSLVLAVALSAGLALASVPSVVQVKDINPLGDSDPRDLTRVGSIVYFSAETGTKSDRELWASDGTAAGTRRVKDINPSGSSNPKELAKIGNALYFSAKDKRGRELWRTVALFVEVHTPSVTFRFNDPQKSTKRISGRATCTSEHGCPEVKVEGRLVSRGSGNRRAFELVPVSFSLHAGESHRFKLGFPRRAKNTLDGGKGTATVRVASVDEAGHVGTDSVKIKVKPR